MVAPYLSGLLGMQSDLCIRLVQSWRQTGFGLPPKIWLVVRIATLHVMCTAAGRVSLTSGI